MKSRPGCEVSASCEAARSTPANTFLVSKTKKRHAEISNNPMSVSAAYPTSSAFFTAAGLPELGNVASRQHQRWQNFSRTPQLEACTESPVLTSLPARHHWNKWTIQAAEGMNVATSSLSAASPTGARRMVLVRKDAASFQSQGGLHADRKLRKVFRPLCKSLSDTWRCCRGELTSVKQLSDPAYLLPTIPTSANSSAYQLPACTPRLGRELRALALFCSFRESLSFRTFQVECLDGANKAVTTTSSILFALSQIADSRCILRVRICQLLRSALWIYLPPQLLSYIAPAAVVTVEPPIAPLPLHQELQ